MGIVDGKVAFVTGAARGQGRSHAVRLAEEGADILAVDLCRNIASVPYDLATPDDLAETATLVQATGRKVVALEADVRDYASLERAVAEGTEELGELDIVVANAGIVSFATVSEMSEQMWQDTIDINLSGVFRTVKAALPHMADGGSIVITSSNGGLKAYENCGHYVAAKHGLTGLMRTLAKELAPRGIRVNTVNPTSVKTDMLLNDATLRLFCPGIENPTWDDFAAVSRQEQVLDVPWVEPADVSNAILFMVSDATWWMTGVALPVDAGNVIK
jgi:(+)-trans-carveol dehydrogenase